MTAPEPPVGITDRHAAPKRLHACVSLMSLLVPRALIATAMTGWLAGDRTTPRRVEVTAATLTASIPDRLRNGEFFEMRLVVTDRTDMIDATVAVAPALWRNMTINSMVPAGSDEEIKPGAFRFRHGPLKASDTLEVKITARSIRR